MVLLVGCVYQVIALSEKEADLWEYEYDLQQNITEGQIDFIKGESIFSKEYELTPESLGVSVVEEKEVKYLPREERKAYYKKLVEQYDWHHGVALAIIHHESQYGYHKFLHNPEGHRGCNGSYGPMQMACLHIGNYGLTWDNIYDPEANVRAGYLLWKERGFKPWGVCWDGKVRCWL